MKRTGMMIGVLALAVAANAEVTSWTGDVTIGNYSSETDVYTSVDGSSTLTSLNVGFGLNGNGTLDVSGGTLTSSSLNVGMFDDAVGTLNVNGGTLNIGASANWIGNSTGAGSKIYLSSGSVSVTHPGSFWMGNGGGNADINISGGTWNGGKLLMNLGGTVGVSVTGSTANVFFNDSTVGSGATTFSLTADGAGVSLLDFNVLTFDGAGTQTLNIDISNYNVANGTSFDIVNSTWGTFTDGDFDDINIVGGSGDLTYTPTSFGTLLSLDNIDVIPEPATIGMMGLGALAMLAARRQKLY